MNVDLGRSLGKLLTTAIAASAFIGATQEGCVGHILGEDTPGNTTHPSGSGQPSAAPDAGAPPQPFVTMSPRSYTRRVKNLLTGMTPTPDELSMVADDPSQLPSLIDAWLSMPEGQAKLLLFFENAFQQSQFTNTQSGGDARSRRGRRGWVGINANARGELCAHSNLAIANAGQSLSRTR